MTEEKMSQITDWVANNAESLPIDERLMIMEAHLRFMKAIEPIYDKHNGLGPQTFNFIFQDNKNQ